MSLPCLCSTRLDFLYQRVYICQRGPWVNVARANDKSAMHRCRGGDATTTRTYACQYFTIQLVQEGRGLVVRSATKRGRYVAKTADREDDGSHEFQARRGLYSLSQMADVPVVAADAGAHALRADLLEDGPDLHAS